MEEGQAVAAGRVREVNTASLLQHGTFVVEQKRKLFEMQNQYRIFDPDGTQIGTVEQVDQSVVAVLARFGSDLDVALPMTLEVADAASRAVLRMHKPWFRRTFSVSRSDGTVLGSIAKSIRLGKARFAVTGATGSDLGEIRALNWRAKNFTVVDHTGVEVAQTTKEWRGLATELFTDADTYVVTLGANATDPLRSIALAASLAIDVVMKQKDR